VVCSSDIQAGKKLEYNFAHSGLKLQNSKCTKSRDLLTFTWKAIGTHNAHEGFVDALLQNPEVLELTY
jgi:hypothetical protein